MLPQASVSTWLFSIPSQVHQFSTLLFRTQLSHVGLALSDPNFPVLLSAFHGRPLERLMPEAKLSAPCVCGSEAESPGEPDSHVKKEGLFLSVSCVMR